MRMVPDYLDVSGLLAVGFQQYGDENQLEENPMQHLFEVNIGQHMSLAQGKQKIKLKL